MSVFVSLSVSLFLITIITIFFYLLIDFFNLISLRKRPTATTRPLLLVTAKSV